MVISSVSRCNYNELALLGSHGHWMSSFRIIIKIIDFTDYWTLAPLVYTDDNVYL